MKLRIVFTLIFSILFVALLVSCAKPTQAPTPAVINTPTPEPANDFIPKLEPILYLTANGSFGATNLYGVYEFKNQLGQHCTVVADIQFNSSIPQSNSAPSITCN